jgi:hypothetical protein
MVFCASTQTHRHRVSRTLSGKRSCLRFERTRDCCCYLLSGNEMSAEANNAALGRPKPALATARRRVTGPSGRSSSPRNPPRWLPRPAGMGGEPRQIRLADPKLSLHLTVHATPRPRCKTSSSWAFWQPYASSQIACTPGLVTCATYHDLIMGPLRGSDLPTQQNPFCRSP